MCEVPASRPDLYSLFPLSPRGCPFPVTSRGCTPAADRLISDWFKDAANWSSALDHHVMSVEYSRSLTNLPVRKLTLPVSVPITDFAPFLSRVAFCFGFAIDRLFAQFPVARLLFRSSIRAPLVYHLSCICCTIVFIIEFLLFSVWVLMCFRIWVLLVPNLKGW